MQFRKVTEHWIPDSKNWRFEIVFYAGKRFDFKLLVYILNNFVGFIYGGRFRLCNRRFSIEIGMKMNIT